ncbi:hypothetical protein JX265_000718 [Neoarthrinium moseri]|uniref:Uncharacterized protein n=1 Tax=Neoarthrinium moseri TaxID=1658444 RepID=A0A9P9WZ89_9PEZI|nr:uncharacterized protein JN550_001533 [Neoarthrinium moseri]KAI1876037.1 hypothetical protein JN550_001533 [Neoarthrinium moseri]KAI1881892.1 hypothetical protein JX265_000718 [Neoarthrinium moseri]
MAPQYPPAHLLGLPSELRQIIYKLYLPVDLKSIPTWGYAKQELKHQLRHHSGKLPALAITCKSAYREMRPLMLNDATAVFTTHYGAGVDAIGLHVYGPLRLKELRKLTIVTLMGTPETQYPPRRKRRPRRKNYPHWIQFLSKMLHETKVLEEITVDWNSELRQKDDYTAMEKIRDFFHALVLDARNSLDLPRASKEYALDQWFPDTLVKIPKAKVKKITLLGTYPRIWPQVLSKKAPGTEIVAL